MVPPVESWASVRSPGFRNFWEESRCSQVCLVSDLVHSLSLKGYNMLWCNLSQPPSTTQLLTHSPTSGIRERVRRVKARKLVSWIKDSLMDKAKAIHTTKAKQIIPSLFPMGWWVFSHLWETRVPSHIMVTWEDKHQDFKCSPVPLFSTHFICWAWCYMVWTIPSVIWGQLSQLPVHFQPPCQCNNPKSRKGLGSI